MQHQPNRGWNPLRLEADFLRRKSLRRQAWRAVSALVIVTTVLQMNAVGLFAPEFAQATPPTGSYSWTFEGVSDDGTNQTWSYKLTENGAAQNVSHVSLRFCFDTLAALQATFVSADPTSGQPDHEGNSIPAINGQPVVKWDNDLGFSDDPDESKVLSVTFDQVYGIDPTGAQPYVKYGQQVDTATLPGPNCPTQEPEPETGSVTVNKWLWNGQAWVMDNTAAYYLGLKWTMDNISPWHDMGTTMTDVSFGNHVVTENSILGYHTVGYFISGTQTHTSCEDPIGSWNYFTLNVQSTTPYVVNFCNAPDSVPQGDLVVHKQVDTDGDGNYDIQNDADANALGFQWQSHGSANWHDFGTTVSLPAGTYELVENNVPNYHLVGWEFGQGINCADTNKINPAPIDDIEINAGETTHVTFCNALDTFGFEGWKFNDLNGNGQWDGALNWDQTMEPTLDGWTIFIDLNGNGNWDAFEPMDVTDQSSTSKDQGHYAFDGLPASTYRVCEIDQAGWHQTYPIDVQLNKCHSVTIGNNLDWGYLNFGNQVDADEVQEATLVVHKQYDDNGDGTIDRTNPTSWTWDIVGGAQNNLAGQAVTLTPGSYNVTEDAEANYTANWTCGANQGTGTTFPITLTDGQAASCTFTNRFVPVTTIALDKTGPAQTNPGSQVTYNLTWSVAGNTSATNAIITDPIPADTSFVSATNGGTFSAGTVTWNLGTQAPGANGIVSVTVTVSAGLTQPTTLVNTGTFDTDQTPPVSDTVNTSVIIPQVQGIETEPDITLTKTVDGTVTNPGETLTYTLKVFNSGTEDAMNVVVTDTLPEGFTFADDGSVKKTWTFTSLAVGETKTITYDVIVGQNVTKGSYTNVATADADELEPVSAEADIEVRVPQVLGLATTGMGLRDYLIFTLGLTVLITGFALLTRRQREFHLE